MSSADHVEFYWVPHTGWALTKRNRRTDEPARPRRARRRSRSTTWPAHQLAFGALCRVGRRRPRWIPRLAKIIPVTGRLEYTDRSDRVFTSPRRVRFYEMEYAIPREAVPEALNRVRRLVDESGIQLSFPVEVRVVAPDDIPLSTAQGRATGYIAVHVYQGHAVRRLLPGRRADHGQLRRAAPLGQDALPAGRDARGRYPAGTTSKRSAPARSRGPVHEPVPRARARPS